MQEYDSQKKQKISINDLYLCMLGKVIETLPYEKEKVAYDDYVENMELIKRYLRKLKRIEKSSKSPVEKNFFSKIDYEKLTRLGIFMYEEAIPIFCGPDYVINLQDGSLIDMEKCYIRNIEPLKLYYKEDEYEIVTINRPQFGDMQGDYQVIQLKFGEPLTAYEEASYRRNMFIDFNENTRNKIYYKKKNSPPENCSNKRIKRGC
ncbi:MAG: hypothetical protein PHN72_01305 [Bacilli bacterium]|nr:hypothetical protein [Bacilli bacterium]